MKKVFALSIIAMCALGVTGCNKKGGEPVDSTKAQLKVATFDGGVGDQWLKKAAKLFEEKNAERDDFQEGRVGVQIHVTSSRGCSGGNLEESDLNDDIYFTESVDYYKLTNQHKLADITDIFNIFFKCRNNILDLFNSSGIINIVSCFHRQLLDFCRVFVSVTI